jgi:hypothetical protein
VIIENKEDDMNTQDSRFKTPEQLWAEEMQEMVRRAQEGPEIEIEFTDDEADASIPGTQS